MSISNAEWWMRAVAQPQPEVSIPDRLKQAAELMVANIGQALLKLVDPPYPTPDGKPLSVRFYQPEESLFSQQQMEQLTAIAKMFQEKN